MKKKYIKLGETNINPTEFLGNRNFLLSKLGLLTTLEKTRFTPIDLQTNKLNFFIHPNLIFIHFYFQFLALLCHQQIRYPAHLNYLLFKPLHKKFASQIYLWAELVHLRSFHHFS